MAVGPGRVADRASSAGPARNDRPVRAAPQGEAGRVAAVQRQVRPTLALAAGFTLAAPVTALLPHRTGQWLPLHLFLVGGLLLAISGATQLFAVTWAAGPPGPARLVTAQRLLLAGGATGLALGREVGVPDAVLAVPATAVAAALVVLAVLLDGIARGAVQRRFDVALRWYRSALVLGGVGVTLGIAMVTGSVPAAGMARVRDAHVVLNVLGLVGLVVAGTLPFFVATQAKMRMARRAQTHLQDRIRWGFVTAVAVTATALLTGHTRVAGGGLATYTISLIGLGLLVPRPGRRQFCWAGPRLLQLSIGVLWWTGSVAAMALSLLRGGSPFPAGALAALVVGGYGQILAASMAYLGPVLRGGGHQRLAAGFSLTGSWPGLVAGNAAAIALTAGHQQIARAALAIWMLDSAWRALRLHLAPDRPTTKIHQLVGAARATNHEGKAS